jgi:PAS domain S-box-containing protein
MKPFRNLPIQRKMLVMTLVICGTIFFVAIAALFTFQVLNFRSNFQSDNETLAAIIANNSTAALSFKDAKDGAEVLGSLKAVPYLVSARLVTPDGAMFAQYGKTEDTNSLSQYPPLRETRFSGGYLLLSQPVVLDRKWVGTLYLRSNFRATFFKLIEFYGLVILDITILSVSLAIFLSSRFQRVITDPIMHLARTAQTVGEKKDYSLRATISSQGDELGLLVKSFNEMLGRIQNQDAALSLSQQRVQALINSIDGIVWECDSDKFHFSFVSQQCLRILGFPPEAWLADAGFWQSHLHPDDKARTIQVRQEQAQAGNPYSCEYRMLAADGRVVWIRESGSVLTENGKALAMRGIFLDITEHKTAADELERLNRRLLETSRTAGMAEVATGVLHNVGNVLNSVSVSATLVTERLKKSNIANLNRATAMLHEQSSRLAEYLTTDPKGKLLPEYLGTVANHLAEEQDRLIAEMNSVGKNIEHIKEIVAMQQNFAKVSGAYETLSAVGLVEDALRINAGAFERHRVRVIREFDKTTPPLCVDRHKALQILINLFSNAKYAMDVHPTSEKRLVIRVGTTDTNRVKITVSDNGVGIPPENLVKIFSHGFTTKKDGHGFGLHSCANTAKEMGGSLIAHSDGQGKGASFTLELPVAKDLRQEEITARRGTS